MPDDDDDDDDFMKALFGGNADKKVTMGKMVYMGNEDPREMLEEMGIQPMDIADAPEHIKAEMREILANGGIEFPEELLEELKKLGISKDEIVAGMLKSIGGTTH